MRQTQAIFLSLFTLIFLAVGFIFWQNISPSFGKTNEDLLSPLDSNQDVGLNQWFPSDVLGIQTFAPNVTAEAALFVEANTGKVLYSKNVHQKLAIASLVKVMTAVITLEHKNLEDKFMVSKEAEEVEPDEMILLQGERMNVRELLYGIFLVSANDAAEVLAENVVGSKTQFVKLMNDKALQIGMKDTYFANPTGLDEDENNTYSTAYDLALLTRYAIKKFPVLVELSKTDYIFIPANDSHRDFEMFTGINLLTTYPGVVGFKTGYTPQAGYTLITLAQKDGHEVIGILLNSQSRRDEARMLLDYSFSQLQ